MDFNTLRKEYSKFIYNDYKSGKFSKKAFISVCILETVAAIGSVILFILSL